MGSSNKPTFHRRLFYGLVIYSVILVSCFAVFQYFREKDFKAQELNIHLQDINDRILDALEHNDTSFLTDKTLRKDFPELRISVINPYGNVIYDNSLDRLPKGNHLSRKEIAEANRRGEGFSIRRHSDSTGNSYFYSAKKRGDYLVRTAVPYSISLHQLLAADYGFLWFMICITAVMCLIGYFATRKVGVHIDKLNRFAQKVERGERITDTEPFPHDELGEISNHIVRLYARLQEATIERDMEHRAAMREEKEKIRIKRQLTNNINHELKTPVASMQVCLETLATHENMPIEKRREFIERCIKANHRLQRLLEDVSAITRLEDGGESISREPTDMTKTAAEICDELNPQASEKGIEIVNGLTSQEIIDGNTSLIESIFRNLIGNAIAYSGGSQIRITAHDVRIKGEPFVAVSVSDNGNGVPEEHIPHLFERFYRVDKGRSRQRGGTGLGLSIVKNAVLWHGGTISVAGNEQGGLTFTFTLRKME